MKSKDARKVSVIKIIGLFCLMYFTMQIFALIQLFIYNHYKYAFSPSTVFINLLIYTGALLTLIELFPEDFIFKKDNFIIKEVKKDIFK